MLYNVDIYMLVDELINVFFDIRDKNNYIK